MSVFSLLLFFLSHRRPDLQPHIILYYYERSELLIDGDGKKKYTKKRAPSPTAAVQLLADHILEDYCTYSPFHLFWRQKSFRRAIASSVHAGAVGSASPTQILPASDSGHRPRRDGVRLAYRDPYSKR